MKITIKNLKLFKLSKHNKFTKTPSRFLSLDFTLFEGFRKKMMKSLPGINFTGIVSEINTNLFA